MYTNVGNPCATNEWRIPQNSKLIHYKLDLLSNIQTRGIPKNRVVYDQIIFPSSGVKFQWLFFGVSCW